MGDHQDNLWNQGRDRRRDALGQRDDDLRRALHHSRKALDDAGKQRGQHLHSGVHKLRQHGNRRVYQPRNGPGEGFVRPVHAVYHAGKSGDDFRDRREELRPEAVLHIGDGLPKPRKRLVQLCLAFPGSHQRLIVAVKSAACLVIGPGEGLHDEAVALTFAGTGSQLFVEGVLADAHPV